MASDLTPEELAELRKLAEEAAVCRRQFEGRITARIAAVLVTKLPKLLDMAERCADYDRRLSEVMPKDFKDWHQNAKAEWPEVAAGTITNLRKREDWAHAQMARALEKAAAIHRVLVAAGDVVGGHMDPPLVRQALLLELSKALRALDDKEQRT